MTDLSWRKCQLQKVKTSSWKSEVGADAQKDWDSAVSLLGCVSGLGICTFFVAT